jgi:hypothetical protein
MINTENMTEEQKINKVSDKFTDEWIDDIIDYMMYYDLETTDDNIDKVIQGIVKIYS